MTYFNPLVKLGRKNLENATTLVCANHTNGQGLDPHVIDNLYDELMSDDDFKANSLFDSLDKDSEKHEKEVRLAKARKEYLEALADAMVNDTFEEHVDPAYYMPRFFEMLNTELKDAADAFVDFYSDKPYTHNADYLIVRDELLNLSNSAQILSYDINGVGDYSSKWSYPHGIRKERVAFEKYLQSSDNVEQLKEKLIDALYLTMVADIYEENDYCVDIDSYTDFCNSIMRQIQDTVAEKVLYCPIHYLSPGRYENFINGAELQTMDQDIYDAPENVPLLSAADVVRNVNKFMESIAELEVA